MTSNSPRIIPTPASTTAIPEKDIAASRFLPNRRRGTGGAAVLAALALFQATGEAGAEVGDLTPDHCIEQTGGSVCGQTAPGLDGADSVAASRDGESVYAVSFDGDAIVEFARDPDGSLSSVACFQNPGGSECDGSEGTTPGLDGAAEVVVSPDGKNVYVVSSDSNALTSFARASDGSLTALGCIQDDSENTICKETGGNTPGIRTPTGLAISPDGKSVYVAGFFTDSVAVFTRAPNGSLTPAGCIQNSGRTNCDETGGTTPGLDGAYDVAVSRDGESVYVVAYLSNTIVTFDRAPNGSLTPAGCIQNTSGLACTDTGGTTAGLEGPRSVAVSPGGTSVYVGSFLDDAVVTFSRDPDGSLTPESCIQNTGGSDCSGSGGTTAGLDGVSSTVVSQDGRSVYVASLASDAITVFDRALDGSLTPAGCIQNTGLTACTNAGGTTTAGLDGAIDTIVGPGGTDVYVASFASDAVVAFDRESAAPTSTTTTSTAGPTTTTTLPPETTTTLMETTTTLETTTTTEPVTTTTVGPAPECGDVNDNGAVTAVDALAILRAAVGGNECASAPCACDVAGGGSILTSDALAALRIAVGQPVTGLCTC